MTNLEILETWFRRVWAEEDMDAIAEMFVPDTRVRGILAQTQVGPEAFRPFAEAILSLLENVRITIDKYMENNDWASALISVTARARASGDPIRLTGQVMVRFGNDTIAEAYNHIDFISMYEQLGLMPADTQARCLGGTPLRGGA